FFSSRRRHTRFSRDWSSDVCSSDLVGAGSHPELIRVQVELGQLEDRLTQLQSMRPSYVARLNTAMNRPHDAPVAPIAPLPGFLRSEERRVGKERRCRDMGVETTSNS